MVVVIQFVMWCDVVICVYRQYEHWRCHFYGKDDIEGFRAFLVVIGIRSCLWYLNLIRTVFRRFGRGLWSGGEWCEEGNDLDAGVKYKTCKLDDIVKILFSWVVNPLRVNVTIRFRFKTPRW